MDYIYIRIVNIDILLYTYIYCSLLIYAWSMYIRTAFGLPVKTALVNKSPVSRKADFRKVTREGEYNFLNSILKVTNNEKFKYNIQLLKTNNV